MSRLEARRSRNRLPSSFPLASLFAATACSAALVAPAAGQDASAAYGSIFELGRCTDVVIPQARSFPVFHERSGVELVEVRASIKILEETAATTLEIVLRNDGPRQAEAVLLLPVPDGAAVSNFAFDGPAPEPIARVLPRDQARRLYDEIVNKLRDPALLEFAGFNLIRSSLFPVPPRGEQRVRLTYEHLLERDGQRIDYVLLRSESLAARTPWELRAEVRSSAPISMVYSPSHELSISRVDARHVSVRLTGASRFNPGPFRLSWLREAGELSASLFAYPDPKTGGGYFLLMAGLPAATSEEKRRVLREVTVVIDRSGSMAGPKMEQARAAALQVVEGLADGECFNVIDYSTTVSMFAEAPVRKDRRTTLEARDYLAALRPVGGTNIYDALSEALRQPRCEGTLPIVLFLTDGLPTVRNTSEEAIRELVEQGNAQRRRFFTFGVGADVNAPLLDRIADATRASATYVLPGEDVEVKVGQVYRRLYGPVLSDVRIDVLGEGGRPDTRRARDLIPSQVPDRFEGDSVVVLGQYVGEAPLAFRVSGDYLGRPRDFRFEFDLSRATTRNSFVPRLWATRRIAYLVDQVRELGASLTGGLPTHSSLISGLNVSDSRIRELTDEILRLSAEFGILTEYTSFLATDGANLGNWRELADACRDQLEGKAVKLRSGVEAVAQACNFNERKQKETVDYRNAFVGEKLERIEVDGVQQVCDRAFFQNRGQWVDGRLIRKDSAASAGAPQAPDQVIEFGTDAHKRLLEELIEEGRQSAISLRGDILLEHRGRRLLVRNGQ
jgi:Ca-activated chloride channel family protein